MEPWRKEQKATHLQRGDGRPTRYTVRSLGHVAARASGHAVSKKKQEAPDSSAVAPLPTRCICRSTSLLPSGHPHDEWRCLGWTVGRYGSTRHLRPAVRPPTPRSGGPTSRLLLGRRATARYLRLVRMASSQAAETVAFGGGYPQRRCEALAISHRRGAAGRRRGGQRVGFQ
jgi:hypothetical protein